MNFPSSNNQPTSFNLQQAIQSATGGTPGASTNPAIQNLLGNTTATQSAQSPVSQVLTQAMIANPTQAGAIAAAAGPGVFNGTPAKPLTNQQFTQTLANGTQAPPIGAVSPAVPYVNPNAAGDARLQALGRDMNIGGGVTAGQAIDMLLNKTGTVADITKMINDGYKALNQNTPEYAVNQANIAQAQANLAATQQPTQNPNAAPVQMNTTVAPGSQAAAIAAYEAQKAANQTAATAAAKAYAAAHPATPQQPLAVATQHQQQGGGSQGAQQATAQPLTAAQSNAQNMYLQALQKGDNATVAQIAQNFGINPAGSGNLAALQQAAAQGQNILDPQVYGRIMNQAIQSGAQQNTSAPANQQSNGGVPFYGTNTNGFGQYSANLDPNLTLNAQNANQVNDIMKAGFSADMTTQANLVGKDSPYYNELMQEATWGYNPQRGDGKTYNADGQFEQILPFGGAYNAVAAAAAKAGKQVPPDLAAALQAMDAYANGNMDKNAAAGLGMYGPTGPAGGATNFGDGTGGVAPGETAGYSVGGWGGNQVISAINPTQQSLGAGGLFGDEAKGGPGNYIGSPSTPVVTNTGVPYQDGATVHPAAAQIVPPGGAQYQQTPPQTYQKPQPIESNYQPGTSWSPEYSLPLGGQGNPYGNSPVWTPENGYMSPVGSQGAQGNVVGQPQGASLTSKISDPTADVFSRAQAQPKVTGSPTNDVFGNDFGTRFNTTIDPTGLQQGMYDARAGVDMPAGGYPKQQIPEGGWVGGGPTPLPEPTGGWETQKDKDQERLKRLAQILKR